MSLSVFFFFREGPRPVIDPEYFKVEGTEKIDGISLQSPQGEIGLKFENNQWRVNGKWEADLQMIKVILATMKQVEPRRPVATSIKDSVLRVLTQGGTHVKLSEGGIVKFEFLAGGNTLKTESWFLRRGDVQPYIMMIPGYRVYVAGIFELDESGWRKRKQWAESFVAGHGPHEAPDSFPRFSYIPLPTIGHSHADGMIRRALIAETPDAPGNGRSAAWAEQRLGGLTLRDEENGTDTAILRTAQGDDGVFQAYCPRLGFDRWQTITPIILPGFDDNDRGKRLKLLLRCFDQIGIPRDFIADIDVQKSPWSRASAQTRAYKRSERLEHLPGCHVRVYFKRSLAGPLVIGAGRHRGLGVLAVWD